MPKLPKIILVFLIVNLFSLSSFSEQISTNQISELIKTGKIVPLNTNNDNSKCVMILQINGKKFCSLVALDEKPQQITSKVWHKIKFDERPWNAAWSNNYPLNNSRINVVEHIVNGDNINNWKELITETSINGDNVLNAGEYAHSFISSKDMKIIGQIFNESEKEAVYEAKILNPKDNTIIENALTRAVFVQAKNKTKTLYLLTYSKKAELTKKEKTKWLNLLKESSL